MDGFPAKAKQGESGSVQVSHRQPRSFPGRVLWLHFWIQLMLSNILYVIQSTFQHLLGMISSFKLCCRWNETTERSTDKRPGWIAFIPLCWARQWNIPLIRDLPHNTCPFFPNYQVVWLNKLRWCSSVFEPQIHGFPSRSLGPMQRWMWKQQIKPPHILTVQLLRGMMDKSDMVLKCE